MKEHDKAYKRRRVSQVADITGFQLLAYRRTDKDCKLGIGHNTFLMLFTCHTIEYDNNGHFTYADITRYFECSKESATLYIRDLRERGYIEDLGQINHFHSKRLRLSYKAHVVIKHFNRIMIQLIEKRVPHIYGKGESIKYSDIKAMRKATGKRRIK